MKSLKSPLRTAAFWAGMIGIVVLMAPAAKAFTFNDAGSDKRGDTTMFNDPVNRAKSGLNADSGDRAADQRPKSGLYFGSGQSQSFDQRNSSERYFNPNTLMGR